MVLLNFIGETGDIETVTRYNGGWLKNVTGLDKSKNDGFSILGNFVKGGNYKMDYSKGLYLDCSKGGSRKNQRWNYHLFKVDQDGFHLLQVMENGGRHWACEFWETIESELDSNPEVSSQDIVNMIYQQTGDEKILSEVYSKLGENLIDNKRYYLSGQYNRRTTKSNFEGFLDVIGLIKVTQKGLDFYTDSAIAKINATVDEELDKDEWEKSLLIAQLYSMISADFDMPRVDLSNVWFEEIMVFSSFGYFYEYKLNKYVLITKELNKVKFAKVNLHM